VKNFVKTGGTESEKSEAIVAYENGCVVELTLNELVFEE
jgi:hypothetical protein